MKLILVYTLIAGIIAAVTAPIPGTSLLLTGLEVFMIVHLAKVHEYPLGIKEIGYAAAILWGVTAVLKATTLEILTFFPVVGWVMEVIVAVVFVAFVGSLAHLHFRKPHKG
jgi:uncharacterized protein (DUF697 family)